LAWASWQIGGVLYVPMTTSVSPIIAAPASLMYELVRLTVLPIEMHATSDKRFYCRFSGHGINSFDAENGGEDC
jgi:hypothetical protein